jgi:hypothetical protein
MALRILNATPAMTRGGVVRTISIPHDPELRCQQAPVNPASMDLSLLASIVDLLYNHKDAKLYTADDFVHLRRFVTAPAGFSAYHSWMPEDDPALYPELNWHALAVGGASCAMYVTYVLFEDPPANQSITFLFDTQDGCRFPTGSALANMARPAPSTNLNSIRDVHKDAADHAGEGHPSTWDKIVNVGGTIMSGLERLTNVGTKAAGAYSAFRTAGATRAMEDAYRLATIAPPGAGTVGALPYGNPLLLMG